MSITRRDFLATASAATLGALASGFPRVVAARAAPIVPTADAVIVLWMAGGMAHTETFDPKRYTPFETGLHPDQVLSTFPAIDTAVDHIKISQGLEHVATRDGSRDADPHLHRGRPRLHPPLAASVPLAHRIRAAADGRRAAPRRDRGPDARAEEPGRARRSSTSASGSISAKARS